MDKKCGLGAVVLITFIFAMGCSKKSDSPAVSAPASTSALPATSAPVPDAGADSAPTSDGLSAGTRIDGMDIKRMNPEMWTMDVFDPNPVGAADASQPGALVLALCGPRFAEKDVSLLSDAAYPIILSAGSQVILHRDTTYQFADGSNASSRPAYVLMTCHSNSAPAGGLVKGENLQSTASVQVKHLSVGSSTMEVLDPNPKGTSAHQPGALILVTCTPRITDSNIGQFVGEAYPILMTKGSQLALKRDTTYQFGDGSSAASSTPEVVLSCD